MDAIAGVFASLSSAKWAIHLLRPTIPARRISLLVPGDSRAEVHSVPTTEDMPPVGREMAATLGGALGLGVATILLLPAVGAVTALGVIGAALGGIGGAALGGFIGKTADTALSGGLPVDELYVYEDALRQGRTVLIVLIESKEQGHAVRGIMSQAGAESVDAAREDWWTGIRDAEEAKYVARHPGKFAEDEPIYRRGFEAALLPGTRGRKYEEVVSTLRSRHPDTYMLEPFQRGYESGLAHYGELVSRKKRA